VRVLYGALGSVKPSPLDCRLRPAQAELGRATPFAFRLSSFHPFLFSCLRSCAWAVFRGASFPAPLFAANDLAAAKLGKSA
jgi:hypothetical protein